MSNDREETRIVNGRVYKVTHLPPGKEIPLNPRENWLAFEANDEQTLPQGRRTDYEDNEQEDD